MTDRQYKNSARPESEVYMPMPMDRKLLGQKKVEQLQKQIAQMENDQLQRRQLIEKLNKFEDAQGVKQQRQDHVIDRYSKRNLNGNDNVPKSISPGVRIDNVLAQRTKEYTLKQQEKELETKYLVKERERLQAARDRIREQRRAMLSPADTSMSEPDYHYRSKDQPIDPSRMSVHTPSHFHSVDTYIQNTINTLPQTMDRIAQLRQEVQKHYHKYQKPYRGEMGIQTYYPHQIPNYFLCRGIVDDVVNNFLDLYFKPAVPMVEKEAYFAIVDQREREREQAKETLAERKAIQLMMEAIVLDVTGDMSLEVAQEDRHSHGCIMNMVDLTIINRAEAIVTRDEEGRKKTDPAYNVVTKQYFTAQQERNGTRSLLFYHTQPLTVVSDDTGRRRSLAPPGPAPAPAPTTDKKKKPPSVPVPVPRGPKPPPSKESVVSEQEDPDTLVIEYHHLAPADIRHYDPAPTDIPEVRYNKERFKTYMNKEVSYWNHMVPYIWQLRLPQRCKGVNLVSISPNSKYVAFGTSHGDCIIYDTEFDPWRPIRVVVNDGRADDSIINMSWSTDCQRIITINYSGALNVWSFLGGGTKKSDARRMGLPSDLHGVTPQQLGLLLDMDASMKDFTFHEGQLADEAALSDIVFPNASAFFPSFTFLGVQDSFCVGLENGDILKCDLEFVINAPGENETFEFKEAERVYNPQMTAKSDKINIIGRGVEAELLRQHKAKVIHIGFMDNINQIVSVDAAGYIFLWKYKKENLSNVGWFKPYKKMRISRTKDMYEPTESKPKLIFTDKVSKLPGKRTRTRQEIANERALITNNINNMMLGDPWHVEYNKDNDTITSVYQPKGGVKDTGAVFHIVIKHRDTDQLSSYVTRVYKPVKVKFTKMSVKQSPDGNELIFLLLFPSYPPKEPCLTVVILDLKSIELRDFRRDIYLSEAEYTELDKYDVVHADVSRVFGPTGSTYLFITIRGDVKVISLNTGKQVVKMEGRNSRFSNFAGCVLDTNELELLENTQVSVLSVRGKLFSIFNALKSNRVYLIEFEDENSKFRRREMWKYYESLDGDKKRIMPAELRVDTLTSELEDKQHPSAAMRAIVLECMDKALQNHHRARYNSKQKDDFLLWDKVVNYKCLERPVHDSGILTGT